MSVSVTIDGVDYVPMSALSKDANETTKAVIRMFVAGYYVSGNYHRDGGEYKKGCDCAGCQAYKLAIQFFGGEPPCKEDAIIEELLLQLK